MISFFETKINLRTKIILSISFSFLFLGLLLSIDLKNILTLLNKSEILLFSIIIILFFLSFSIFISSYFKTLNLAEFIILSLFIIVGLLLRIYCFDFQSGDYQNFLSKWVLEFKSNNHFFGLKNSSSDYFVLYLYYIAFISFFDFSNLYLIKLFSILFDFILAIYVMKIIRHYTKSKVKEIIGFCVVLFFPTVWLNGAYWGQCDIIYTTFVVMSFYYGIIKKPKISMVLFGFAFCFKLQAIFFLPVIVIFYLKEKIKLFDLLFIPLTFVFCSLPAILFGKPIKDTLLVYYNQTNTYGNFLNLNSPSIFAFANNNLSNIEPLKFAGIFTCFSVIVIILYVAFVYREKINDKSILIFSLLFVLIVPWFLPSMHERYFILGDIFSIILVISIGKKFFIPLLVGFSSLLSYRMYLFGGGVYDLQLASLIMFLVICILVNELKNLLFGKRLVH